MTSAIAFRCLVLAVLRRPLARQVCSPSNLNYISDFEKELVYIGEWIRKERWKIVEKINDVLIVDPVKGEFVGDILIDGERIERVIPKDSNVHEYTAMPGFIDWHTHGCMRKDTMRLSSEELEEWEDFLYSQGVTTFLPTTVSAKKEDMIRVSKFIDEYIQKKRHTSVYGVHYEGPYINVKKKGAQNPNVIRIATVEEMKEVISPVVKLITMAPEIEGFYDVLPVLKKNGTVVSLGHMDADFEEMKCAFFHDVNRITHFPNAIKGLHHRELGGVGAGLYLDFKIEMIVDGIHLAPEFVDMVYRIKGADKITLITDSIDAAGLKDGKFNLGGLDVTVKNGKATLSDGTLAGSTLLFNRAVKNFKKFTNCSLKELTKVSSYNAARDLEIEDIARIKEGYKANIVLLDDELNVVRTYSNGEIVYEA